MSIDTPGKNKIGICTVLGAFYPEISGGAVQSLNLMNSLNHEYDFYVIATYKVSSERKRINKIFVEEVVEDVKVFRINLYPGNIISEFLSLIAIFVVFFKLRKKVRIFHMYGYTRKSYILSILAKIFGKKIIVKSTSSGIDDSLSIKRSIVSSVFYSLADAYIVTSPAQLESSKMAGLPGNKIYMIPNGVNLNRFNVIQAQEKISLREEMGIPASSDVILSVTFFSSDKGVDLFAESLLLLPMDKLNNIFLIFVGSRDNKELEVDARVVEKVYNVIDNLNMKERSLFIDPTHDIGKYFMVSDIFILPSKREGLPNALLEAMACELCCIANRLEGITDYIIDYGKNGYLLDILTPESIAGRLEKVIGNKELQASLGKAARLKVKQNFNMNTVKEKYKNLYNFLSRGK